MNKKICIIGGGYVGLPLAVAFANYFSVTVVTKSRLHAEELSKGFDRTETFSTEILQKDGILFTSDIADAMDSTIFIVSVPTPVKSDNMPDLSPVEEATKSIASVLKKGDIVIYESTVFIGCTEEFCVPILVKESTLTFNQDFYVGFSPERINPADKEHTIHTVVKIIAGSTQEVTKTMEDLYGKIVHAGLHIAPSIKTAEASKLVENIQRDVNIALINELSKVFHSLGVDTNDVINAAATKWNFIPFRPGLVGGHCISIDPYYMLYNGKKSGIDLPLIKLSRSINSTMVDYVVNTTIDLLKESNIEPKNAEVLMLGITFKENCPDIRNSQSASIFSKLNTKMKQVDLFDPVADHEEILRVYGINTLCIEDLLTKKYDAIIITVAHTAYKILPIKSFLRNDIGIILDLKSLLPKEETDFRL
ncbi:MAG: nucleotide sugar dehydrogenase [Thiovulaceae bacterium]|nr:nucleotide sugar dehydrogenase [Sulfurimonadaceae bacterium]